MHCEVNNSIKNLNKPESQQLFCSMDQGAAETDSIPKKRQQNSLNLTNLLKFFFFNIILILEPITLHNRGAVMKSFFSYIFKPRPLKSSGFTQTICSNNEYKSSSCSFFFRMPFADWLHYSQFILL